MALLILRPGRPDNFEGIAMKPSRFLLLLLVACQLGWFTNRPAIAAEPYAADDMHNHDGSHPAGAGDCGTNYMLPGETARMGSHSFIILGQDGTDHIIVEHRSGTPPHNYQFLLRIRLDPDEIAAYHKVLQGAKTLPAFTTIYYDAAGVQRDRTFFCLQDLPRIFNPAADTDEFSSLFPIRASLQRNADHEGGFAIKPSVVPGLFFSLARKDVEVIVYRYLPAYLPQDNLRKAIKANPEAELPLLGHAPLFATEAVQPASQRKSYIATDGAISAPGDACQHDYYLKNAPVPKTIHNFMLVAEVPGNTVIAAYYADQAPHNWQTALALKLSDEEMKAYRAAKAGSKVPPVLQTRIGDKNYVFCMSDLRKQIASGEFKIGGTIYRDSDLRDYRLGKSVGQVALDASKVTVLMNRNLASLMNPLAVAKDVLGH
ncbi:hypothetical protein JQ604_06675 [Bradyrhizobium jicamae]|uniref:hypothetical protein n=1 Tax=Bradyrhizobium jicamae TaxID=280332 RepID=UPI001BA4E863|nr:hypothetical protein [Bradyrhizobium jicamae]MBR0751862.1 hypothetical protein [Bradyrhizobium jicamae]